MKLYILVNSSETLPGDFDSQLDKCGLDMADSIVSKLSSLTIDDIYSSPFLTSLQTIYPYCYKYNRMVNVECAFSNIRPEENPNYYRQHSNGYSYILGIINPNYKTKVFSNNISICEEDQDIINRVFPILYKLCKTSEKNTLIVTHQSILNYILYFFDRTTDLRKRINDNFMEIDVKLLYQMRTEK